MRFRILALSAALLTLGAGEAGAQDYEVTRRAYSFFADNLNVEVDTESPGVLRILRGTPGRLEVTGHTPDGVAAFGLARETTEKLRLTAVGDGRADFVVVVPERVSVNVWLPGNTVPSTIGLQPSARYEWDATPQPAREPGSSDEQAFTPAALESVTPATAYTADVAPHGVSIPQPENVRRLSVRIQGDDFRVGSSVPLRTLPGNAERLEIRTAGEPVDLLLQLPRNVAGFMLKVGPDVALAVNQGEARVFCSPVTAQQVSDGRRWFDFTPRDGRLLCQP